MSENVYMTRLSIYFNAFLVQLFYFMSLCCCCCFFLIHRLKTNASKSWRNENHKWFEILKVRKHCILSAGKRGANSIHRTKSTLSDLCGKSVQVSTQFIFISFFTAFFLFALFWTFQVLRPLILFTLKIGFVLR